MSRKKTWIISLSILVAAAIITTVIFLTEPKAVQESAVRETAMLVEVTSISRGSYSPEITANGVVEAALDVILSPKVGGEVVRMSPVFTPGGFVKKGHTLLQVELADYENTLMMRKSDLLQAQADLNLEMGRQNIAQKDFQLLEETVPGVNESLVLREPQLNTARSRVEAALAGVKQAELALERTSVKAPFDAHVIDRNVNVGSRVAPGDELGRLVGMEVYWVMVTMPVSKLRWLSFPEGNKKGAEVRIRNRSAWKDEEYRTGNLYKLVGALDNQTRLARLLVTVPDPLAQEKKSKGQPPLIIGEYVEANITANELKDVIRLPRDYIRKDETVWVMKNGKLAIRKADIVFTDSRYAYISEGLEEDDMVVVTNLRTVVEGAGLRTAQEDTLKQSE
jgi:RND family efflux transporter MFP subunit